MSERGSHEPTLPPTSATSRIDQICDEFERACRAGKPPLIEEYLMRAAPGDHTRLLTELLEIELDCRQRSLTFVQSEDYRCRFPDQVELVESVFQRVVKVRRLAEYDLLEELGRGGMGVVYKARQIYLNQIAAVKILPHRYLDDPQAVNRFRREMQSIGALNHPNIVRAYNAGEAGGVHYLAMEFVDGANLQRYVSTAPPRGGPVGVGAACEILRQAATGLQHAHEHQLVHRDIKPANLMLAREGLVKVLDMGLAKFHLETHGEAPVAESLTQPGMTMGTIDYMAPEQWENSANADIRADIYSLGCTLFFLLTGKPPYGEPEYETGRKKLMAHAVAPIPSLTDNCADVPQELDEIYQTMMAKSPQDRYSVPAEVAAALAEFADAEELAEVIADLPAQGAATVTDNTDADRGVDTPRRHEPTVVPLRRTQNRWSRRQKFRRNVTIGVAAGLTAALCVLLAWVVMHRSVTHGPGPQPAENGTASSNNTAEQATRNTIAAELALLPGLNGDWWFDETPWLMPFVRQALAKQVLSAHDTATVLGPTPRGYLSANTNDAEKWLWDAAQRCRGELSPPQQRLLDGLHGGQSPEAALLEFVASHGREWPTSDLHTVAVLQHAAAKAKNDSALAAEAKKSYDKAVAAYAAEPNDPDSTESLCLADCALLDEQLLDDTESAKQLMEEVLNERGLPVPFHATALVERGRLAAIAAAHPGDYEDHRFSYAKKLLEGDEAIRPNHPLVAFVTESYAWSLMDQWRVEEASKQFQSAFPIRLFGKGEKEPLAAVFGFRDRRGAATASRFRGNFDSSRRGFKVLVDEIQTTIDESAHARRPAQSLNAPQPFDPALLREQLALTREAWADGELFGGAASGGKVNLSQAAENYEQARQMTSDPADALALQCKLTMVRSFASARSAIVSRPDDLPAKAGATSARQRAALAKQLAEAVVEVNQGDSANGRKLLRAFLDQFKLGAASPGPHRREIVEMQLLAVELLLTTDLADDLKFARRDLRYLDALLTVFQGRRDMRPYLRRYYGLAVRACGRTDLVDIARYIMDSRMAESPAPGSKATLLIFSFTTKENFAILLPQDGRPGKRFDLDFTRDDIKSSHGKPLRLNEELAAKLKDEVAAGRPVEVYWSDQASHPGEDPDALGDGDWPFDSQFKLAQLRGERH